MTPVKVKEITPKDKQALPEKFFIRIPMGYAVPSTSGQAMNYLQFFKSEDAVVDVMCVGDVVYECSAETRIVCKREIVKE